MKQSRLLVFTALCVLALGVTFAWGCQPKNQEMSEDQTPAATEEVSQPQEMPAEQTDSKVAETHLQDADGNDLGTVTFTENDDGTVTMVADLHDVDGAGAHGIHVHENGECSAPDFKSAGGHFNPKGTDHACPPTAPRHAGDFGNIDISADGTGHLELTSDLITVTPGDTSVVGKAVILHGGEDDCTSQPSGAAGPRIACGVIATSGDSMMMDEGMDHDDMGQGMDEGMDHDDMGKDDDSGSGY